MNDYEMMLLGGASYAPHQEEEEETDEMRGGGAASQPAGPGGTTPPGLLPPPPGPHGWGTSGRDVNTESKDAGSSPPGLQKPREGDKSRTGYTMQDGGAADAGGAGTVPGLPPGSDLSNLGFMKMPGGGIIIYPNDLVNQYGADPSGWPVGSFSYVGDNADASEWAKMLGIDTGQPDWMKFLMRVAGAYGLSELIPQDGGTVPDDPGPPTGGGLTADPSVERGSGREAPGTGGTEADDTGGGGGPGGDTDPPIGFQPHAWGPAGPFGTGAGGVLSLPRGGPPTEPGGPGQVRGPEGPAGSIPPPTGGPQGPQGHGPYGFPKTGGPAGPRMGRGPSGDSPITPQPDAFGPFGPFPSSSPPWGTGPAINPNNPPPTWGSPGMGGQMPVPDGGLTPGVIPDLRTFDPAPGALTPGGPAGGGGLNPTPQFPTPSVTPAPPGMPGVQAGAHIVQGNTVPPRHSPDGPITGAWS